MKKSFLLILSVAFTLGLNAQIRYGVKVGGTLSNVVSTIGERSESGNIKIGVQAGGMLEYSFNELFALQPELQYVLNGSSKKGEIIDAALTFHNIQLPINLKVKFGVENLKFYATAGPYLGLLAAAKTTTTLGGISGTFDMFDKDFRDFYKLRRMDFGIGVGLGVELSKIAVGVGYQFGLANLQGVDNTSMKVGTFNLSLGYFF